MGFQILYSEEVSYIGVLIGVKGSTKKCTFQSHVSEYQYFQPSASASLSTLCGRVPPSGVASITNINILLARTCTVQT